MTDNVHDLPLAVSVEDGKVTVAGPGGMTLSPDAALILSGRLATAADAAREAWLNTRHEDWKTKPRP